MEAKVTSFNGATTLGIIALSLTAYSSMAFRIMPLGILTLKLDCTVEQLSLHAEWHYVKCPYAELHYNECHYAS
jgi:hypothetical protein